MDRVVGTGERLRVARVGVRFELGDHRDRPVTAKVTAAAAASIRGAVKQGAAPAKAMIEKFGRMAHKDVTAAVAIGLCLLLAGVSGAAGLAPIVGAFAAGLILDEVHVRPFGRKSAHDLTEIIGPIVAVMAPIFFVRTGMMVQLGGIGTEPLILAGALTVVAIIGKLVSGLGVRGNTADRLTVGIGMVPRGEVGLIFAELGRTAGVFDGESYAAVVLVIAYTTLFSPFWIKLFYRHFGHHPGLAASPTPT